MKITYTIDDNDISLIKQYIEYGNPCDKCGNPSDCCGCEQYTQYISFMKEQIDKNHLTDVARDVNRTIIQTQEILESISNTYKMYTNLPSEVKYLVHMYVKGSYDENYPQELEAMIK